MAGDIDDGPGRPRKLNSRRIARARRMGTLGARAGTGLAFAGARGIGRSDDRKAEILADATRRAAEQARAVLGDMKGVATKLGQLLSFIDAGQIPEQYREIYQEVFADLRDDAPPMPFSLVAEVFEADHGGPPDAVFSSFEAEPFAAASIGQVHRARLFDGTRVVVKIQYPGIADTIRADMKNAKAFMWLLPMFAPGLDADALVAETERMLFEELDYRTEAAHHRRFADAYRDHPFIVVPEPVPELCGERTLVTEEVTGAGFDALCRADQAARDRAGEILFRFAHGTLYRFGFFNADTHPGNYAFRDDGKVVFYDFGATKTIGAGDWQDFVRLARLLVHEDVHALFDECVRTGFIRRAGKVDAQRFHDWLQTQVGEMVCRDTELTMTPEYVSDVVARTTDPLNDWYSLTRWLNVNSEALMIGRMQIGIMAVLAKIRATANWHRIAREWIYDDPPATELGAADVAFFASHPGPA